MLPNAPIDPFSSTHPNKGHRELKTIPADIGREVEYTWTVVNRSRGLYADNHVFVLWEEPMQTQ